MRQLLLVLALLLGTGCLTGHLNTVSETSLTKIVSIKPAWKHPWEYPPKISLDLAQQIALGNLNSHNVHWFEATAGLYGAVRWQGSVMAAYQITIVNHNPEADSLLLSYIDADTGEILFDQQQVLPPQSRVTSSSHHTTGCLPHWYRCVSPSSVIARGVPAVDSSPTRYLLGWLNLRVGNNVTPVLLTEIWPKLAAGEPVPVYQWDSWKHQVEASWIVGHDGNGYILQR